MRVLIDMDGVLVDLVTPWLAEYNRLYAAALTHADIRDYRFRGVPLRCARSDFFALLGRPGLFRDLPPILGAVDALAELVADGHELAIVTAAPFAFAPDAARDKWHWCEAHLRAAGLRHDFVVTDAKRLVRGDVLVEDSPEQLADFPGRTVGVRWPWNVGAHADAWVSAFAELPGVLRDWSSAPDPPRRADALAASAPCGAERPT